MPLMLMIVRSLTAQDLLPAVRAAFRAHAERYLQEELYVHTDREAYLPGDICWFRVYAVDAVWHRPAEVSKIAYVDLIDADGNSRVQEKVSLRPGEQGNSFVIPVDLPTGAYTFRAYTRWMKNDSPEWFFHKTLSIINPSMTDSMPVAVADTQRLDIQFFPEGGNLVKGLNSRVGFRVTDGYGQGQPFEGCVTGPNGDTIAHFRPERLGIGQFGFTPSDTAPAGILLKLADGRLRKAKLPPAYASGYVMRLDTFPDEKRLRITVTSSGMGDANLLLAAHTRGSLRYARMEKIQSGQAVFTIDRDSLGFGISVFTLSSESGNPLCERLYYRYPRNRPVLSAHTGGEYAPRKQVDIDILLDSAATPAGTDLSVAVYRPDLPGEENADNTTDIQSYLSLVADLGHPVENPGLYFSDTLTCRAALMDNLMLTQGWRRFSWKEILNEKSRKPVFGPEFNGHIMEARMVDARTNRPRVNEPAYLSVPGAYTRFRITQTDSSGNAVFEMPWFYNSDEIVLQTDPAGDSRVHFEMISPFAPGEKSSAIYSPPAAESGKDNLTDEHVRNQVQRIYTGPQMRRFDAPAVDTGFFYGSPDEKYMLDDFVRFTTMEEVLREYVVSINVYRKKGNLQLEVFDVENKQFFSGPPLLLIDGIAVFDQGKLFRYDPLKIRRLDLVTRPYFLGQHRFDGIMNLVTYRGNLDGFEMDAAANVLEYPGINAQREFYSPRYETEQAVAGRLPDFRSLLFWTPGLKVAADGRAHVSFYTSDLPGSYSVVIQGLTTDGQPVSKTVHFEVKK